MHTEATIYCHHSDKRGLLQKKNNTLIYRTIKKKKEENGDKLLGNVPKRFLR
ncbi:hypothetical protein HMPREF1981_02244 [Bacteroides pyogenes F0041]|uniref:Uncharacterized protein n=1 Tax=Bacteroides pyogenes F0041 TaxID=1321819 RepID=U2CL25_9BACE|nr:hypothetical protein HMPREF1981_02244 [Bacteroides pyogenes F0041]GAE22363.1 hypothetical protein JCM10003_1952 [Bacteroides pyogenes JCM 10003]